MKIEKSIVGLCVFVVILIFTLGVFIYKIKNDLFLQITSLDKQVNILNEKIDLSALEIHSLIKEESDKLLVELNEINFRLDKIQNLSKNQFNATKKMKNTYDELLEEQKKQTIDITQKDLTLVKMIFQADEFYKNQDYINSYKIYSKVLLYQSDNMEVRCKKLCSLYYMNPMDSSCYQEILEDCRVVKNNGCDTDETNRIENAIKQEMEGLKNE